MIDDEHGGFFGTPRPAAPTRPATRPPEPAERTTAPRSRRAATPAHRRSRGRDRRRPIHLRSVPTGVTAGPRPGGDRRTEAATRSAGRPPDPDPRRNHPSMRRRPVVVDLETVTKRSRLRLGVVIAATFVLFGLIVVRLVDVEFNQRQFWSQHGFDSRIAREDIRVERGGIYDRNGAALALSVQRPDIIADPTLVTDPESLAADLAPLLGRSETELLDQLRQTNRYQVLSRGADDEMVERLRAAGDGELPVGIFLEPVANREYPSGDLALSIVGRVYDHQEFDADGSRGRFGVEAALDQALQGEPGQVVYERDRAGGPIAGADHLVHQPTPGVNVYLTIDRGLQHSMEQMLIERVEDLDATEASAIVMRPSSGEILAMSTVAHAPDGTVGPTSDNRSATAIFEPGSVSKMITVAAALEEEQVGPDTVRRVPDRLQMADKLFTDHDPHPTELWSTSDILTRSSNIGTIQIAQSLGERQLDSYLRSFGFGATTGSDLPGEVRGLLSAPEHWSGTSLGSIAIGQGLAITPLQLISAYNVIANDGTFVAPHTIGATDAGGGPRATERPAPRRVVSPETARTMREILTRAVAEGTGRAAAVPGYRAWGKTGTARIPQENPTDPTDGYRNADGEYDYTSSFVGGIDGADLTIAVVVTRPRVDQTGGAAAAPLFSRLASLALRSLDAPTTAAPADGTPETRFVTGGPTDVRANAGSAVSDAQG